MAKNLKKGLSAILAALMCMGTMSTAAFAAETYITNMTLENVVPGSDSYNYMIAQDFDDAANKIYYYETSNHTLTIKDKGAVHIFPIIDTTRDVVDGSWESNGIYECGESNYNVVYCCDAATNTRVEGTDTYYKRLNLEDSEYLTLEQAARLRAIISNSYPALSVEEANEKLKDAGFEEVLKKAFEDAGFTGEYNVDLDRSELISATQGAIWILANADKINTETTYRYCITASTAQKKSWGGYMHDYSSEFTNFTDSLTKKTKTPIDEIGIRINALQDFFLNKLDPIYADELNDDQIVITDIDMVGRKISADADSEEVTLRVKLNQAVGEDDNISVYAYVNDKLTDVVELEEGDIEKEIVVTAGIEAGDTVTVVVDGTQFLERGVYFYAPKPDDYDGDGIATAREISQNLIGLGQGETSVHAEKTYVINTDKTATPLYDNDYTDVTLKVAGEVKVPEKEDENESSSLPVDIIYILGRFLSYEDVKADTMIGALTETFKELLEKDIPVNFGIVPFSSTMDPVMPLTSLTSEADLEELPAKIAEAIEEADVVYDGVNMENALLTATEMFSASELGQMGRPDRQHLVMISSGHTYYFNSGDNNEYISTVPVSFKKGAVDTDEVFYMEKAWMRARNNSTNSYPIPKAIAEYYKENSDKYSSEWDCYWSLIDQWSKADIAAGDSVVYEATTREAGDFVSWLNSGKYSANPSTFTYSGNGAVVSDLGDNKIEDVLEFDMTDSKERGVVHGVSGPNPFLDETAAHAISYERAMWEAYTFIQEKIIGTGEGINFYPVYNPLRADGTASNGSHYDYTWTTNYIGHCFMNMLAGGEAVWFDANDVTFFDGIKAEITKSNFESTGKNEETEVVYPFVEDFIGYGEDYDFDFTGNLDKLVLKVDGEAYVTVDNGDNTYSFYADGASEPSFTLEYIWGNGKDEERFVWTFLELIEKDVEVTLTYQLELVKRNEEIGEHIAYTNQSATLYPEGDRDNGQVFPEPWVEYGNEEPETPVVPEEIGTKDSELLDRDSNRFEITVSVPGKGEKDMAHDEVIVMVDGSTSVNEEWPAMREAVKQIGDDFLNGNGNTQLTLMAFGISPTVVKAHITSYAELEALLDQYQGNLLYGRSGTNCSAAFDGITEYITEHDETLEEAYVIYISDGRVNLNNTSYVWKELITEGNVIDAVIEEIIGIADGAEKSNAYDAIFGDKSEELDALGKDFLANVGNKNDIITNIISIVTEKNEDGMTKAQLWASLVLDEVFEFAELDENTKYPMHVIEKAFVDHKREEETNCQELFYCIIASLSDNFKNTANGQACAISAGQAAAEEAEEIFLIRYDPDDRSAWMGNIDRDNVTLVDAGAIANVSATIKEAVVELSKTPFNDVVVTDYMSKWVNLDASTLKIVDDSTGETIWTAAEGWAEGVTPPTEQNPPVVVELVDPDDYENGGEDVIGNTSGDIYKLTWYVKDDAMLRSDNYSLKYEVTVDTAEEGFDYNTEYPANGNTNLNYKDENGIDRGNEIEVPDVDAVKIEVNIRLHKVDENGDAISGAEFTLFDANGNVVVEEAEVDDEGKLVFENLLPGSYKLVETEAPDGYIGVDGPMYFEIVANEDGEYEVKHVFDEFELEFPATAYEISNHITSVAIPQTFVLLDAENADEWTYSGEYVFGESDYRVVYCGDSETNVEDGTHYVKTALEECFDSETANKLRAIIANSYPYVSMEDMIAAAVEAGVADAENLTRGDLIAAVQLAIWHYTNEIEEYTYKATYSVEAKPDWGKVFNDYSGDLPDDLPTGPIDSRIFDEASDARIRALYSYLIALEPMTAAESEINTFFYTAVGGKDVSQSLIGGDRTDFYTNGLDIYVKNTKVPEIPEEPETPPTVSFNEGEVSNISFMLIDKATGKIEWLYKKNAEEFDSTTVEIPYEEGKISAVFMKQGNAQGMFWFSEEVDENIIDAVIECVDDNKHNPSYKGYSAVAFGDGDHSYEFKNGKTITYTFTGCEVVEWTPVYEIITEDDGDDEIITEDDGDDENITEDDGDDENITEDDGDDENITEDDGDDEITTEPVTRIDVAVYGAEVAGKIVTEDGIIAVYIAANGKVPAVIWTSEEVDDRDAIIDALRAVDDAKYVFGFDSHEIEYPHNKNKTKTVTYTFECIETEVEHEVKVEPEAEVEVPETEVTIDVAVYGAEVAGKIVTEDGIIAVYIAANGKVPAVIWTSAEVDDLTAIIDALRAVDDAKYVFGFDSHEIEYPHNKNKNKTVTYTFFEIAE